MTILARKFKQISKYSINCFQARKFKLIWNNFSICLENEIQKLQNRIPRKVNWIKGETTGKFRKNAKALKKSAKLRGKGNLAKSSEAVRLLKRPYENCNKNAIIASFATPELPACCQHYSSLKGQVIAKPEFPVSFLHKNTEVPPRKCALLLRYI